MFERRFVRNGRLKTGLGFSVVIAATCVVRAAAAQAPAPAPETPPAVPPAAPAETPPPGAQPAAPPAAEAPATQPAEPEPAAPPAETAPAPTEPPATAGEAVPLPPEPPPEEKKKSKMRLEIYGFAMTDFGHDFRQVDPDWFDVVRPTKLPSFEDEFGTDGNTYASVRQSRFGVKGYLPTPLGELRTTFEFEMFGVGVDAGQTTIRLRHAYGEIGQFGAGQYWSPFMDIDVFPNSVEYWGPSGMVFFRNVQVRWMPLQGDTRATIALERPGASADLAGHEDRVELQDVAARFPLPDLSGEFRYGGKAGYVELAGIVRRIEWEDRVPDAIDLSGDAWGWGLNLSSNIRFMGDENVLKLAVVYGEAIENYMNDGSADIGVDVEPTSVTRPIRGKALPVFGLTAFVDLYWTDFMSSSLGYSLIHITNSDGQAPSAFQTGHYALGNVLFYPTDNFMLGPEYQFARRSNNSDGWDVNDYRIQVSFKYSFAAEIGGGP